MPDRRVLCFPSDADLKGQPKVQQGQLELFDWARNERVYFCIVEVGRDDGEMLLAVIRQINVRCILDLRNIPLFGQTIRKHREFFQQIYLHQVCYIDLSFGSSGVDPTGRKWFRSDLRNLIRRAFGSTPIGVCLLLVDPGNPVEESTKRLRNLITSRGEKYIELHPSAIRNYWGNVRG